jgi:hypothetical protein
MLCPEDFPSPLKVDKSTFSIMPNANNSRLVAWYELYCHYTTHSWLMKLLDDTDSYGLQLKEL